MFIGHLGFGMVLKKADNRLNLGVLFVSVLALDLLLWIFILFGLEQAIIPQNYAEIHYLKFQFPYSHSLFASVIWSLLAFTVAYKSFKTNRLLVSLIVFSGVFSHFILDYLEHPPQIPLIGNQSLKIGLGLWNQLPIALGIELALLLIGSYFYFSTTQAKNKRGQYGLLILLLLITIMAFSGQMFGPPPPDSFGLALSSLIMNLLVCGLAFWLDAYRLAK